MLKNKIIGTLAALLFVQNSSAQFAPQATLPGSTAIHRSSPLFTNWANGCTVARGYMQIDSPSLGFAAAGIAENATGMADGSVVSLGDSGVATLTFPVTITNGDGPDFAVFENGFPNPLNSGEAFLELAFVEVSSNGTNFFRFPAQSFTQVDSQISSVAGVHYMNASLLYNLAGKYIGGYGVPFDLEELSGTPGLDINQIHYVRLVDVIGDIGAYGSNDANGNRINEPFPTPFPAGGFDLDAVGVLHASPLSVKTAVASVLSFYPNPARDYLTIQLPAHLRCHLQVRNVNGQILLEQEAGNNDRLDLRPLPAGVYFIQCQSNQESCVYRFIKQ